MGGGTEAFPELGKHCQFADCNQLDFLPFCCDGCRKVFCLEHRSYKSHECSESNQRSRRVVVCDICSTSIETTGNDKEDEKLILEKHEKSGDCDPSKKKKPKCPVRRCREILTFSNTISCKLCQRKVCLNHRFPAGHACSKLVPSETANGVSTNKFLLAFAARNSNSCARNSTAASPSSSASRPTSPPSAKAC